MSWQLADAKNRLSEVVNLAISEGPQFVTRRNDRVVIISIAEYEKLTTTGKSFKDFLMHDGPAFEDLDVTRDRSPMRDVNL